MFCKNCGQEIPDGVKVCGNCGTPVPAPAPEAPAAQEAPAAPQYQAPQQQYQAAPQPQYQAPQQQYTQPVYAAAPAAAAQGQPNTLVFGILSLVFCCIPYVGGIAAIIMGAIGRGKGKRYVQAGGTLTGASKVGYILSLVGLIFGIIMTIVWAIVIIVLIVYAAKGGSSSSYNYWAQIIDYLD